MAKMTFAELYEKFGRTDKDREREVAAQKAANKDEDVLYDIKDDDVTIPDVKNDVESLNLSDDDMNKLADLLAARLQRRKEGDADGNN